LATTTEATEATETIEIIETPTATKAIEPPRPSQSTELGRVVDLEERLVGRAIGQWAKARP